VAFADGDASFDVLVLQRLWRPADVSEWAFAVFTRRADRAADASRASTTISAGMKSGFAATTGRLPQPGSQSAEEMPGRVPNVSLPPSV